MWLSKISQTVFYSLHMSLKLSVECWLSSVWILFLVAQAVVLMWGLLFVLIRTSGDQTNRHVSPHTLPLPPSKILVRCLFATLKMTCRRWDSLIQGKLASVWRQIWWGKALGKQQPKAVLGLPVSAPSSFSGFRWVKWVVISCHSAIWNVNLYLSS